MKKQFANIVEVQSSNIVNMHLNIVEVHSSNIVKKHLANIVKEHSSTNAGTTIRNYTIVKISLGNAGDTIHADAL